MKVVDFIVSIFAQVILVLDRHLSRIKNVADLRKHAIPNSYAVVHNIYTYNKG
jgi:hypothetical protein